MNIANPAVALKRFLPWLMLVGAAMAAVPLYQPTADFVEQQLLPFGMTLPPLDGQNAVDPRMNVTVQAQGLGTRLAKAQLRDASGKVLAEAGGQTRATLAAQLAFGVRHTLTVTAERPWFGQAETRTISFTTVAMPRLEGAAPRMLGADASVTLHFDRPVGAVEAKGDLHIKVEADAARQTVRLVASDYAQDKTYPVQLQWQTTTGVPLPPVAMELVTAPALSVETNVKGMSNLGTALPLRLNFSEKLADRASASHNIQIRTAEGKPVAGKWAWQGPQRVQFTPQPGWPASSTIEVAIEPEAIRSERGGRLEQRLAARFSTGSDRRLFVYLDAQRVDAVENGQVVRSFKVSTGKSKTPTVTGNYYIYDRYPHKTMRSDVGRGQHGFYEVEDVPFTQFFHKDYAFHGAFWHNNFGHPASHGCVNLATKDHNKRWPNAPEDAGWLYRWAALGVPVTVLAAAPAQAADSGGKAPQSALTDGAKEPVARLAPELAKIAPGPP